jgi:hypothetical protein
MSSGFDSKIDSAGAKGGSEEDEPKNAASASVTSVAAFQLPKVPTQYADESYKLFSQIQVDDPTPEEAKIIRNKCVKWILPFICIGYHVMYVDKQTVVALSPKVDALD